MFDDYLNPHPTSRTIPACNPIDREARERERAIEMRDLLAALPSPAQTAREYASYDADHRRMIDAALDTARNIEFDIQAGSPSRSPRAEVYDWPSSHSW